MIIDEIIKKAQSNLKKIVLPEATDIRILLAADICYKNNIANIILIGNENEVKEMALQNNIDLHCTIIDPQTSDLTKKMIIDFYEMRKDKGITYDEAEKIIANNYMYFACMLVKNNLADGVVSGCCHSSADTLKPALQIIKTKPNYNFISAVFLMNVPNCQYGEQGTFIFGDAGLVQNPDSEQLAEIAKTSAETFELLTGKQANVALLSHSTKGSAKHDDVTKVTNATKIAKANNPKLNIDGELQLDAAIDTDVAKIKAPDSNVAGKANVLIFPNLDSGNIGYKLVERLASASAYGPITQGINKPVNDLSRGCKTKDIVGVIAITAIQAE